VHVHVFVRACMCARTPVYAFSLMRVCVLISNCYMCNGPIVKQLLVTGLWISRTFNLNLNIIGGGDDMKSSTTRDDIVSLHVPKRLYIIVLTLNRVKCKHMHVSKCSYIQLPSSGMIFQYDITIGSCTSYIRARV
jgi:hypothetical protein